MIDFRYHLVSLVSVFLALAVGIVLGAGPLKDSIGDQLTGQVSQLRSDRDQLRSDLDTQQTRVKDQDAFLASAGPALVRDQLRGERVVLVVLPGVSRGVVSAVNGRVRAAGATVSGTVTVAPAWTDPTQAKFRDTLAAQYLSYLHPAPPASAGAAAELGAVLARAIVTDQQDQAGNPDSDADIVLNGLTGGNLVTVSGKPTERADLAVVIAGAPEAAPSSGGSTTASQAATEDALGSYLALTQALRSASRGTVLAGPLTVRDDKGLLGTLRADKDARANISTVDSIDTATGPLTAVFALREQLSSKASASGFGPDADAPVPAGAPQSTNQ